MAYLKQAITSNKNHDLGSEEAYEGIQSFLIPILKAVGFNPNIVWSNSTIGTLITVGGMCLRACNIDGYYRIWAVQAENPEQSVSSSWDMSHYGCEVNETSTGITCHALVNKHNNTASIGFSNNDTDPPYMLVTIVYDETQPFMIQHSVHAKDIGYENKGIDSYITATGVKTLSPISSSWYTSGSIVSLVPVVNPWTCVSVLGLYVTGVRPKNTSGIRNKISIQNRIFASGLVYSDFSNNTYDSMITFVEI